MILSYNEVPQVLNHRKTRLYDFRVFLKDWKTDEITASEYIFYADTKNNIAHAFVNDKTVVYDQYKVCLEVYQDCLEEYVSVGTPYIVLNQYGEFEECED